MPAKEKYSVSGDRLAERVKELARQGGIRRIRILHEDRPLVDIPVISPTTAAKALAAPVVAAVSELGKLIKECTIEVEKKEPKERKTGKGG